VYKKEAIMPHKGNPFLHKVDLKKIQRDLFIDSLSQKKKLR